MRNIYFIADTHFNHPSIIVLAERNFSLEEHDEILIKNWNSVVKPRDEVWHLGDIAFGKNPEVKKIISRLNGKKHLILGNHDYKNKVERLSNMFSSIHDLKMIKINRQYIVMCHYPMSTWDKVRANSFHLYGHCHGNYVNHGLSYDVGVDTNNFKPLSLDEIIEIMKDKKTFFPDKRIK